MGVLDSLAGSRSAGRRDLDYLPRDDGQTEDTVVFKLFSRYVFDVELMSPRFPLQPYPRSPSYF
eukprot:scaffold2560_cov70-Cyclotella_meneghiniana.AAC.8